MNQKPIISVKDLGKIYPNGVEALKKVSFDVYPGEFLVIIGLSGSGKSTLLKCLNRLEEPTSGHVYFHGQDISHIQGHAVRSLRTKMAMIFQHFNLIQRRSVLTNVLMGSLSRTSTWRSILGWFSNDDRQKAMDHLKLVGIDSKARIRADQLSGGQQQRVAIARALTQGPEVMLADEPVASLDPATCHTVMDYLEKINKELNLTILCNLHFLSLVRRYATRVIALKGGELVFEGSPQQIDEEWFRKIYGDSAQEVHIQ